MSRRLAAVALVSGRGSNLQALLDAAQTGTLDIDFRAVVSNRPDAPALERARQAGVAAEAVDHRAFAEREAFDAALMAVIDRYRPDLIVLAGFMRILTPAFIDHYRNRMVNIHPSLLPAFPGLDTHARALASGAGEHGATVHFVTTDLDSGPGIVQARVAVQPEDDPDTLAARVLEQEHRIYPLALDWIASGRVRFDGQQAWMDGEPLLEPVTIEAESRDSRTHE